MNEYQFSACRYKIDTYYTFSLKAIAHKTQQGFQSHDLRIPLQPFEVLSWMSVITLLRLIMQMKLAHGPLDAGYTKSHIQGHALSTSVDY